MARLLIANSRSLTGGFPEGNARQAIVLAWLIQPGDILILPQTPPKGQIEYILSCVGVDLESVHIVVAPSGKVATLSEDRLDHPDTIAAVKKALGDQSVEHVLYFYLEPSLPLFVRKVDENFIFQGSGFAEQDGGISINSKCLFRVLAAGNKIPVSPGRVYSEKGEVIERVTQLVLDNQIPTLLKKEYSGACCGNELFISESGICTNGAVRSHLVGKKEEIESYISENWEWFTDGGAHSVIVERFFPGSRAMFVEYDLTDAGVTVSGDGEMLAEPIADGQIMPIREVLPAVKNQISSGSFRLATILHTMGYRGNVSVDCILTNENEVFFTEVNCRTTGSTHIYKAVGEKMIGAGWLENRVLLERHHWLVPSFMGAIEILEREGLSYDPETRSGVVLTGIFNPEKKTVGYSIAAESLEQVLEIEKRQLAISPRYGH